MAFMFEKLEVYGKAAAFATGVAEPIEQKAGHSAGVNLRRKQV